jgi:Methyltransferase FkbM domain
MSFLQKFHPFHVNGLKRMGHKYDGGYVVHYPSIKDADYLVTYGVGYKVDFEEDFFKETGKPTLAFDPTLYEISDFIGYLKKGQFIQFMRQTKNLLLWVVKKNTLKNSKIEFVEEGIAPADSEKYKSMAWHFKKYGLSNKKIILKIDVEGAEYPVFNDPAVYDLLHNSIQILMELHDVEKNLPSLESFMDNISKTHSLIHVHANNHAETFRLNGKDVPQALEVTFLLNKYLPEKVLSTQTYPIKGLDQPCNKTKPDLALNFFY